MPIYLQHDYLLINVGVNMKQSVGYMAKIYEQQWKKSQTANIFGDFVIESDTQI